MSSDALAPELAVGSRGLRLDFRLESPPLGRLDFDIQYPTGVPTHVCKY
jgi:hypothetical protein